MGAADVGAFSLPGVWGGGSPAPQALGIALPGLSEPHRSADCAIRAPSFARRIGAGSMADGCRRLPGPPSRRRPELPDGGDAGAAGHRRASSGRSVRSGGWYALRSRPPPLNRRAPSCSRSFWRLSDTRDGADLRRCAAKPGACLGLMNLAWRRQLAISGAGGSARGRLSRRLVKQAARPARRNQERPTNGRGSRVRSSRSPACRPRGRGRSVGGPLLASAERGAGLLRSEEGRRA